jgi:hypothetical protein
LICSAILRQGRTIYCWMLIAQIAFYAGAMFMALVPRWRFPRLLRLGSMFTSMNAALLLGFFHWLTGGQKGVWRRTERVVQLEQAA